MTTIKAMWQFAPTDEYAYYAFADNSKGKALLDEIIGKIIRMGAVNSDWDLAELGMCTVLRVRIRNLAALTDSTERNK